ncbi:hypothetical protein BSKO_00716 [Bryopsis sp. KO-2023]|nr:hypothetical protein BSKO_00716 [Bryopsis sp. KO-2023]
MASCRNTEVIEIISGILEDLVAGEIMQMTSSKEDLVNMDYYYCFSKTYRNTASLMARCCRAVAVFGDHPKSVCDLAAEYGKNVGMAFQIVDDILDFTASSDVLGKPALNDLKSGLATAPVLLAMEEFPELKPLIMRKFRDSGDVEEAVRLVEKSKGIQKARKLAEDHAKQALEAGVHYLIISGSADLTALPSHTEYFASLVEPNVALKELEGVNHCLLEWDPKIWLLGTECGIGEISPMEQAKQAQKLTGDFFKDKLVDS